MAPRGPTLRVLLAAIVLASSDVVLASSDEVANDNEEEAPSPVAVNLCEACACTEAELSGDLRILCAGAPFDDLADVVWPPNEARAPLRATFEGLGLSSLLKIPGNPYVESLDFLNNEIFFVEATAFSGFRNLKTLSLSYNSLTDINSRAFSGLKLKELDLSHNKLAVLNNLESEGLSGLKTLNLNGNSLQQVPYRALRNLTSLEYLYLSRNEILLLDFEDIVHRSFLRGLKVLDLSYNKIALVGSSTFQEAEFLEELILSNNNIQSIGDGIFENCKALKRVDLSFNDIKESNFMTKTIETLNLRHNKIRMWPSFSDELKELDISENELIDTFDSSDTSFDSLKVLNISGNQLKTFNIVRPLKKLEILDVSFNSFASVPESLNEENFPNLDNLHIDGNPIAQLVFERQLTLRKLSATKLKEITTIKQSALKLKPRHKNTGELNDANVCINLYISHCDKLTSIEDGAFSDIPLCYLDLSYNGLTALSEFSADWTSIKQGVNLQGNPWNCECQLQWMLDELLDVFYANHQTLLHELRCASPRYFVGLRFVHWYKHTSKAFCDGGRKSADYVLGSSSEDPGPFGKNDVLVIVLFVAIIVGVIIAAALITYLIKGKYKHEQRVMQLMKRKRQTMEDAKRVSKQNGQNVALTGV